MPVDRSCTFQASQEDKGWWDNLRIELCHLHQEWMSRKHQQIQTIIYKPEMLVRNGLGFQMTLSIYNISFIRTRNWPVFCLISLGLWTLSFPCQKEWLPPQIPVSFSPPFMMAVLHNISLILLRKWSVAPCAAQRVSSTTWGITCVTAPPGVLSIQ